MVAADRLFHSESRRAAPPAVRSPCAARGAFTDRSEEHQLGRDTVYDSQRNPIGTLATWDNCYRRKIKTRSSDTPTMPASAAWPLRQNTPGSWSRLHLDGTDCRANGTSADASGYTLDEIKGRHTACSSPVEHRHSAATGTLGDGQQRPVYTGES